MQNRIKAFSKSNKKLIQFSSVEFLFWATCACYYPFLVVFLNHMGYSNTTIGTFVSINSVVIIFAQPFWGMASDRLQSVKKVFIICVAGAAIFIQSLPFLHSALLLGITLAIVTFFESALAPLLDSWVIKGIRTETHIAYGSIRLWGSIGFAIMVTIMGNIVDATSINAIFIFYGILGLITILVCSRIKNDSPAAPIPMKELKVGRLFKNYRYVTFVIFATILFIPHRSSGTFLVNLVEQTNGGEKVLGLAFSIMALSEVPIFLFSKKILRKFKPVSIIMIAMIPFILRQVLPPLATAPVHVILIQALQGPSFGVFLTGAVYYIDDLAPENLKSTAQTLACSIFFGLSGIIGSYGGGWIIDNISLDFMYNIGAYMSIAISVLFLLSLKVAPKHEKSTSIDDSISI